VKRQTAERSSFETLHASRFTLHESQVGRRGALSYEFERAGSRTILTRSSCTTPWHHFPPSYLDDSGCAYTWLVNPSGGLVGGDHLSVEAHLHARTHVFMTSPSANRVYRSLSEPALQEIRLSVGADARLEWVPEITIPFAGSRFCQSIHVDLAPGATVVLWDAMASGRVARHERWAFASLENEICISGSLGKSVAERYRLVPGLLPESVGLVGSWDYVASLFIIGDAVEAEIWKRLDEMLATILEQRPGLVLGAVSITAVSGLVVKLVARSAPDLTAVQEAMWTAIRKELWGLPAPNLRRY
jgi:urease accessory protein